MSTEPTPPAESVAVFEWACCSHCGCSEHDRIGHDDICRYGCNEQSDGPAASLSDPAHADVSCPCLCHRFPVEHAEPYAPCVCENPRQGYILSGDIKLTHVDGP